MASKPGSKPVSIGPGNNPRSIQRPNPGNTHEPPYSGSPGGAKPSPPPPTSGSKPSGGASKAPPMSGTGSAGGGHVTPPTQTTPTGIQLHIIKGGE